MIAAARGAPSAAATSPLPSFILVAAALVSCALPSVGRAETTLDATAFRPALHPSDVWGVRGAHGVGKWRWAAGSYVSYVEEPLRLVDSATGDEVLHAVEHQLVTTLYGSLGVTEWLDVAVGAPIVWVASGGQPDHALGLDEATGPATGDLRLSLKGVLAKGRSPGLGLAVAGELSAPTATAGSFSGDRGFTATTSVILDYARTDWRVAANAGLRLREEVRVGDADVGSELLASVGATVPVRCKAIDIVGSLEGRTALADPLGARFTNALDALLGGRLHFGPLSLSAAAGGGLLQGYGSAALQAVAQVAWKPNLDHHCDAATRAPPPARDGDGVADADDRCPEVAGAAGAEGCPDRDDDGVPDEEDACPNNAGLALRRGCPDRDDDGVVDREDRCPDAPGTAAHRGCGDGDGDGVSDPDDRCPESRGKSALHGCPDQDGDGVGDADDLCPGAKGVAGRRGCPEPKVVVKPETRVLELSGEVRFQPGQAILLMGSHAIIAVAASTLRANPQLARVRVEGHTDNEGDPATNLALSRQRAEVVVGFLVQAGVAPERLVAQGYGDTNPIADNSTADGRARNRRVIFTILDRAGAGRGEGPEAVTPAPTQSKPSEQKAPSGPESK